MNKELKDSTVRRTLYPNAIEEQQVNQRSSSSEDGYSKPSSRSNKQATKPLNKTKSEDKDFEKARPKNKKLEYPKNKEREEDENISDEAAAEYHSQEGGKDRSLDPKNIKRSTKQVKSPTQDKGQTASSTHYPVFDHGEENMKQSKPNSGSSRNKPSQRNPKR